MLSELANIANIHVIINLCDIMIMLKVVIDMSSISIFFSDILQFLIIFNRIFKYSLTAFLFHITWYQYYYG